MSFYEKNFIHLHANYAHLKNDYERRWKEWNGKKETKNLHTTPIFLKDSDKPFGNPDMELSLSRIHNIVDNTAMFTDLDIRTNDILLKNNNTYKKMINLTHTYPTYDHPHSDSGSNPNSKMK